MWSWNITIYFIYNYDINKRYKIIVKVTGNFMGYPPPLQSGMPVKMRMATGAYRLWYCSISRHAILHLVAHAYLVSS
jgi:hypothetical protein